MALSKLADPSKASTSPLVQPSIFEPAPVLRAERPSAMALGGEDVFALIHGGHDAHVAVCHQTAQGGRWHERILTHDEARFAVAAVNGAQDCYLSQHGFNGRNRRIQSLRVLTSCAIDLDYYNRPALAGLTPDAVMARIFARHAWLPQPSALFGSGRGAYLQWAFAQPLSAYQLADWQAVMDALIKLLEPFGADPNAKDASRVFRIVGTVNSKSGRTVTAHQLGPRVPFETLHCAVLDAYRLDQQQRQIQQIPTVANKRRSHRPLSVGAPQGRTQVLKPYELALARLLDYRTLAKLRGTPRLTDGRHRLLYAYAMSMCWFRADVAGVIAECENFAAEHFTDPQYYTARRIKSVLERLENPTRPRIWNGRQIANRYRIRNDTLIRLLDITPAEMRHVKTLIDYPERQRRRAARRRAAGAIERAAYLRNAEQRRAAILTLSAQGKTARAIAAELGVSRAQVYRILAAQPARAVAAK